MTTLRKLAATAIVAAGFAAAPAVAEAAPLNAAIAPPGVSEGAAASPVAWRRCWPVYRWVWTYRGWRYRYVGRRCAPRYRRYSPYYW